MKKLNKISFSVYLINTKTVRDNSVTLKALMMVNTRFNVDCIRKNQFIW